jgi:hypothetical protein
LPLIAIEPKAKRSKQRRLRRSRSKRLLAGSLGLLVALAAITGVSAAYIQSQYAITLRWPLIVRLRWPLVIAARTSEDSSQPGVVSHRLTAYQQYACNKFGSACRTALAIQRAENPREACEVYHYNSDGTLDWGYFQINTVHLRRPRVNLRALLDCKANIDFAYQLYTERGFEPWTTYKNGAYRQFLAGF